MHVLQRPSFVAACVLTASLLLAACIPASSPSASAAMASAEARQAPPRNVILFISDGCGPASFTMARDYLRESDGIAELALDSIAQGGVRTFASNSRVTDSAASATAYACAVKTYNGAIGVDTLQQPVASILDGAEARGMATGLVATSRLTHATPAAFAAHVPQRAMESEIAVQMMEQGIEVLLGGGQSYFLPESEGGRRPDGRNLITEAGDQGYTVVTDATGFQAADAVPMLGLFADSHMAYEIDRDPAEQPSLAEMTAKAIDLLNEQGQGFLLMVEGSRIDHAGHGNDAAAHLHDILAFNEAVATALDFAAEDGETLVVSTSDHETGGLTLGRAGVYAWEPSIVGAVAGSHGAILSGLRDVDEPNQVAYIADALGIDDLTDDERTALQVALAANDARRLNELMTTMISARALVGWTSSGHTAVDVNLYAYGPGAERFVGNVDNTEVGHALAELLNLDLDALTAAMRDAGASD